MLEGYEPSALDEEARIQKASEARQRIMAQKRRPAPSALREPSSPQRNLADVAKRSAISYLDEDADAEDFELPCDELPGVEEEHVEQAFKEIDFDENSFVGLSELRYLLTTMGERPTDEELQEMISMIDSDGKGQVSYDEFRSLFSPSSDVLAEMVEMAPSSVSSNSTGSSESGSYSSGAEEGITKQKQDLLIVSGAAFLHRVEVREHAKKVSKNMPQIRKKGEGQLRARPKAGTFAQSKGTATVSTRASSPTQSTQTRKGNANGRLGSVFHHNPSMF